jgi:hypothetical protein
MENKLNIVNQHLKFKKVVLVEPTKSFYLHIAAEIDHSHFPFFLFTSSKKKRIIEQSKKWCDLLRQDKNVISAIVFKATIIPPGRGKFIKERKDKVQIAKFDFALLIEATTLETLVNIQNSKEYQQIVKAIKDASFNTHIIKATNIKRINPVNHKKQGVFLFNYFFADNLQQNLGVWEYTAGWFQQETGLDNSTILLPTDEQQSKYKIINYCRWDRLSDVLPSLIFKKSFHSYVLDNFYANKVAAMPVLYKIA